MSDTVRKIIDLASNAWSWWMEYHVTAFAAVVALGLLALAVVGETRAAVEIGNKALWALGGILLFERLSQRAQEVIR